LFVVPLLAALEPALLVEPPPLPALGLPSRPAVAPTPATPEGLGFDEPLEQATTDPANHREPTNLEKFMKGSGN
jgi:hypothetical protein